MRTVIGVLQCEQFIDQGICFPVGHLVISQYLSPPLIVSLNLQEEALLKANRKYFEDFGFEIEPFGGKEYCINAVPANLYGLTEEELFHVPHAGR